MWNFLKDLDNINDKDFSTSFKEAGILILETASEGDSLAMLEFAYQFPSETNNYWDLDLIYRNTFEKMESYPPSELFEDESNNTVLNELRLRCYNAKIVRDSPKTPVLNEYKKLLFENLENNMIDFLPDNVIITLNKLEARLILEIYINYLFNDNNHPVNVTLLNSLNLQVLKTTVIS